MDCGTEKSKRGPRRPRFAAILGPEIVENTKTCVDRLSGVVSQPVQIPWFHVGDEVEIRDGSFEGIHGVATRASGIDQVSVGVQLLGQDRAADRCRLLVSVHITFRPLRCGSAHSLPVYGSEAVKLFPTLSMSRVRQTHSQRGVEGCRWPARWPDMAAPAFFLSTINADELDPLLAG